MEKTRKCKIEGITFETLKKITIAIDGYSSCGKSTLAKALAKKLDYVFIDSGSMYRAVTLFALRHELIENGILNENELIALLPKVQLTFRKYNSLDQLELFLNDENVESQLRSMEVAENVSNVAAIKAVREKLVAEQQAMGKKGGVVMDGRDIGSVVFPNAELKIFVTASVDVRTQRRFDELKQKNVDVSFDEVKNNLIHRDKIDTSRKESPLIQTDDAIILDNSSMNQQEQLDWALAIIEKRFR